MAVYEAVLNDTLPQCQPQPSPLGGTMTEQKRLTGLVRQWLHDKRLYAETAKAWKRTENYWYNWFYIEGKWWGINVYDDDTVKRIV